MTTSAPSVLSKKPSVSTLVFLLVPVLLLAGAIALFVSPSRIKRYSCCAY